jgi:hypothetical protein
VELRLITYILRNIKSCLLKQLLIKLSWVRKKTINKKNKLRLRELHLIYCSGHFTYLGKKVRGGIYLWQKIIRGTQALDVELNTDILSKSGGFK